MPHWCHLKRTPCDLTVVDDAGEIQECMQSSRKQRLKWLAHHQLRENLYGTLWQKQATQSTKWARTCTPYRCPTSSLCMHLEYWREVMMRNVVGPLEAWVCVLFNLATACADCSPMRWENIIVGHVNNWMASVVLRPIYQLMINDNGCSAMELINSKVKSHCRG